MKLIMVIALLFSFTSWAQEKPKDKYETPPGHLKGAKYLILNQDLTPAQMKKVLETLKGMVKGPPVPTEKYKLVDRVKEEKAKKVRISSKRKVQAKTVEIKEIETYRPWTISGGAGRGPIDIDTKDRPTEAEIYYKEGFVGYISLGYKFDRDWGMSAAFITNRTGTLNLDYHFGELKR